jgi:hypothetical protein
LFSLTYPVYSVKYVARDIGIFACGNLRHLFFGISSHLPSILASHLQIGMVSSILAYKFGSTFAWITSASVATYIAFTLVVTQVNTLFCHRRYDLLGSSTFSLS